MRWTSRLVAMRWLLMIPVVLLFMRPIQMACSKDALGPALFQIVAQDDEIKRPPPADGKAPPTPAEKEAKFVRELTLVGRVGFGVLRVLDDASFWTALACVVAALRLRSLPVPSPVKANRWVAGIAILVFVGWTAVYIYRMTQTGGTVYWWYQKWFDPAWHEQPWAQSGAQWRYWAIAIIQLIEGIMKTAAMGVLCAACVHGYSAARSLLPPTKPTFDADAAGKLLSTCMLTFPLIFFVLAVFKILTADIGFKDEPPLLFGIKLIGQLAWASMPLIVLAFAAIKIWGPDRRYTLEVGKDLVSIRVA